MLCPEVYPGQVRGRPRCLRDAVDKDPPQFRGKITPGDGAKVSFFLDFALPDVPPKHTLFDLMEEIPMIGIPIRK